MMTTFSREMADWEGQAYGPFVSIPQVLIASHVVNCALELRLYAGGGQPPSKQGEVNEESHMHIIYNPYVWHLFNAMCSHASVQCTYHLLRCC